jgi:P-type E1-E2 ATPase
VLAARERQLTLAEVQDFTNLAGKGVQGRTKVSTVLGGSARLLRESGIPLAGHLDIIEELEGRAQTVVAVARDGALIGVIAIADTLKEDAAAAVARLHERRIETAMITGDNRKTAEAIAGQIGVKRVFAEVLPQD